MQHWLRPMRAPMATPSWQTKRRFRRCGGRTPGFANHGHARVLYPRTAQHTKSATKIHKNSLIVNTRTCRKSIFVFVRDTTRQIESHTCYIAIKIRSCFPTKENTGEHAADKSTEINEDTFKGPILAINDITRSYPVVL